MLYHENADQWIAERRLRLDVVLFAITLFAAWHLKWQATDLIWGFWIASLTIGMLMILVSIYRLVGTGKEIVIDDEQGRSKRPYTWKMKLPMGLFLVGFFIVHFGGFHFVHGLFLSTFFPLEGLPYPKNPLFIAPFVGKLVASYILMIIATGVVQRRHFFSDGQLRQAMSAPYRSVVRMHLMIFLFAPLKFGNVDNFVVYALVLAIFFFPWEDILARKKSKTFRVANEG